VGIWSRDEFDGRSEWLKPTMVGNGCGNLVDRPLVLTFRWCTQRPMAGLAGSPEKRSSLPRTPMLVRQSELIQSGSVWNLPFCPSVRLASSRGFLAVLPLVATRFTRCTRQGGRGGGKGSGRGELGRRDSKRPETPPLPNRQRHATACSARRRLIVGSRTLFAFSMAFSLSLPSWAVYYAVRSLSRPPLNV
jgi:hypothetical protein